MGPEGGLTAGLDILRVATDRYPDVMGGGALHVHEMSRLQASAGHEVTVLTSDHGDWTLPRRERVDGYTVHRYREVAAPFGNSITPALIRGLVSSAQSYDVVHAHSHLYFSTNLAALVAKRTETPLVVTNHGLFSQSAPWWIQRLYVPTVARFTLNAADRVLCYTETDRERLEARGIRSPISVIHNGIDCAGFTPGAGGERSERLLFVGRLKRPKGPHRVLEAFIRLRETRPDLSLAIVGDGPLRSELEERVKREGVADCVTFTGELDNEELPRLYAESAVFALPSENEGLPRTVLEALACETPVVTSDLPQLEPVVEGVGETVPADSVDALATAIDGLLNDPDRRVRLGSRGRERVLAKFSWEETVQRTTDVYYELLN